MFNLVLSNIIINHANYVKFELNLLNRRWPEGALGEDPGVLVNIKKK